MRCSLWRIRARWVMVRPNTSTFRDHQGGAEAAGHSGMSAPAIVPVINFCRIALACIVPVPLNQYQDLGCSFAKYVIAAQRRKFLHDPRPHIRSGGWQRGV
ncbi:hypothetical protein CMUS01_15185 [Colletotrichum musicola]|uniref:Uncharacterized protein n=1 Tax=Colletotrichum musicola TaxID=2175873 RepID=A0A8H6MNH0_9PEZI|nr:hypothetical protein CMUS01_15185 [Colletotrichum musicola]